MLRISQVNRPISDIAFRITFRISERFFRFVMTPHLRSCSKLKYLGLDHIGVCAIRYGVYGTPVVIKALCSNLVLQKSQTQAPMRIVHGVCVACSFYLTKNQ